MYYKMGHKARIVRYSRREATLSGFGWCVVMVMVMVTWVGMVVVVVVVEWNCLHRACKVDRRVDALETRLSTSSNVVDTKKKQNMLLQMDK